LRGAERIVQIVKMASLKAVSRSISFCSCFIELTDTHMHAHTQGERDRLTVREKEKKRFYF